jgi:hypothetical protein
MQRKEPKKQKKKRQNKNKQESYKTTNDFILYDTIFSLDRVNFVNDYRKYPTN